MQPPLGDCGDPDGNLASPFPHRNPLVGTLMADFFYIIVKIIWINFTLPCKISPWYHAKTLTDS